MLYKSIYLVVICSNIATPALQHNCWTFSIIVTQLVNFKKNIWNSWPVRYFILFNKLSGRNCSLYALVICCHSKNEFIAPAVFSHRQCHICVHIKIVVVHSTSQTRMLSRYIETYSYGTQSMNLFFSGMFGNCLPLSTISNHCA
jgi:hypothetical protein